MKNIKIIFCIIFACQLSMSAEPKAMNDHSLSIQSIALSEAPLSQVLYLLEELTGKPVLRDSKLPDVLIDLQIRHAMSSSEAVRAIESALAINHIAIVELGDGLLKAVDIKSAPAQSPQFIETSLLDAIPSEKICSKLFQLKYLSVDQFSKLITRLLNPEVSSAITFDDSNAMLITDSVSNLQRIELLINRVDIPKHSIIESKIFRIKHGDAGEITTLLNKVIRGQNDKISSSVHAASSSNFDATSSSFQFSKNITIEHDVRSNSIVVCGTPHDMARVESIINQLDVLLDQVRIEVIIAQVTLSKAQASGLDSFGFSYNVKPKDAADNANWVNQPSISGTGTAMNPLSSILTVNGNLKNFSINSVFNKAKNDSNVKILSAPTIVTTHNREAVVRIVDSMPVVKSDVTDTTSRSFKSTIEYKDIGMELKVKPLIGINGVIQLEISQCVESKNESVTINGNNLPSTTKREAVSFVSVNDGDAVVLAGLQKKESSKNRGKIWLLGDIPVIGQMLFSPKGHGEKTEELIIFIKPTIVSNPSSEEAFAKNYLCDHELQDEVNNYNETGKFLPSAAFPSLTLADPLMSPSKQTKEKPRRQRRNPSSNYSANRVNEQFEYHLDEIVTSTTQAKKILSQGDVAVDGDPLLVEVASEDAYDDETVDKSSERACATDAVIDISATQNKVETTTQDEAKRTNNRRMRSSMFNRR